MVTNTYVVISDGVRVCLSYAFYNEAYILLFDFDRTVVVCVCVCLRFAVI